MADYTYWHNALAGTFGPIHEGTPQPGFYRKRDGKGGPFLPVAIFEHEGAIVALVNGRPADAVDLWTYICERPITEAAYHAKMRGEPWADEDEGVTQSVNLAHNMPPTDEAELLLSQIEAAKGNAAAYEEIKDDETAAKAQSSRARLLELSGDADKKREAVVRPHLEAQKAANNRWMPVVKLAKEAADKIKAALSAYETRKARDAEKARQAEIERQRKLAPDAAYVPPVPPAQAAPAPSAAIKGAYGRAASVKAVKVARVVDQDKAYMAMRTHKELVDTIAKLAQRAATAGIAIDGVEVTEERRVA